MDAEERIVEGLENLADDLEQTSDGLTLAEDDPLEYFPGGMPADLSKDD
jgi:hypothetical protein